MIRNLLCLLFSFLPAFMLAQGTWTTYNYTNSPLPDNTVRCITIDANNVKWIGTDYGMAFFDGTDFMVYDFFNSNLASNSISAVKIRNDQLKFVCTINGGLTIVSNDTIFTTYTIANSGFPDNSISGIDFDNAGNAWLSAPSG